LPGVPGPAERVAAAGASAAGAPAQLAQEFEAMLLLQMVRQMRQSLLDEEAQGEGLGFDTMTETFDVEFARFLARSGGVGLGRLIQGALPEGPGSGVPVADVGVGLVGGSTREPRAADPVAARPESLGGTEAALSLPLTTNVSSPFGWRADPLGAGRRFHGGIDLHAAYGREVPSAAPGRVVHAADQGAYGQTVVVEHAGGLRTRYAHLSAITVEVGQELAKGEVLGRVGQSGRATGPHLHFEVLKDGVKLNPLEVAEGLMDGLKPAAAPVDFLPDGPSVTASSNGADHEG
jgi:murein DD-endopeptidase MepM/ murein hydrolase activator NlpD